MSTRTKRLRLIPYVSALLIVASGLVFSQTTPPAGPAMTNEDVVKMAKLGFGNDVIEAKIQQAKAVDFKLEVDDLSKLKSAGVSQAVISAMLQRSTAAPVQGGPPPGAQPYVNGADGVPVFSDLGRVKLVTKDHGEIDLRSVAGTMSTVHAFVTVLMYSNFSGVKADVRIQDRRPTLLIKSGNSPKGRFYLVSAEVDSKNGARSVKMGNMKMFGASNMGAPDSDNQIEYDAVAEGPDTWRLTPTKDLRPGEYGLWSSMRSMYDFGIDP
jgi:hypothetical protein